MSIHRPLFVLSGPTASGKTGLALELAKRFSFEIISMDSALVYQGMDIGTAKPSKEELQDIPHHLIDIISPLESYSAAQFVADTQKAISTIEARGNRPLIVGGTFLYLNALIHGLSELPEADPAYRQQLEAEAEQYGWSMLHSRLQQLDPNTAKRINPSDKQRIQRALEIIHLTGLTVSTLQATKHSTLQHTPVLIGLECERAWLHERIARRFTMMIESGFLDEVRHLKIGYPSLNEDITSMRCVGYRQALEYLNGHWNENEWIERGIIATRQLAKRQLTWMRHFPETPIHSFACNTPQVIEKIADFISNTIK